jgi:hypothetical protein
MDKKADGIEHLGIVARTAHTGNYGENRHKLTIRPRQAQDET